MTKTTVSVAMERFYDALETFQSANLLAGFVAATSDPDARQRLDHHVERLVGRLGGDLADAALAAARAEIEADR